MKPQPRILTPDEWDAVHRTTITASRVADIIGAPYGFDRHGRGLHYSSPYQIWAEMTGKVEPADLSGVAAVEAGHRLERPILDWYADSTGRELLHPPGTQMYFHPDHAWGCTPDDLVVQPGARHKAEVAPVATVNAKCVGWRQVDHWIKGEDVNPPVAYQVQAMFEAWLCGVDFGSLAVLIGGQRFAWHDVEKSRRFLDWMIEKLIEFEELVKADIPPELDDSEATAHALRDMYPTHKPKTYVMLGENLEPFDKMREDAKATIKEAEAVVRYCENRLRAGILDNEQGILPSGVSYTLKVVNVKEHTVKASSYRKLTRRKARKDD